MWLRRGLVRAAGWRIVRPEGGWGALRRLQPQLLPSPFPSFLTRSVPCLPPWVPEEHASPINSREHSTVWPLLLPARFHLVSSGDAGGLNGGPAGRRPGGEGRSGEEALTPRLGWEQATGGRGLQRHDSWLTQTLLPVLSGPRSDKWPVPVQWVLGLCSGPPGSDLWGFAMP